MAAPPADPGLRGRLVGRLRRFLALMQQSRGYPLAVGGVAFLATFGAGFAFAPLIVTAVLLDRRRWPAIGGCAALGSAVASFVLFLAFRSFGLALVTALAPGLSQSPEWAQSALWLQRYGAVALLLIVASPIPQLPAIMLAALAGLSAGPVGGALLAGKLVKCGGYAWATATFPHRVAAALRRRQLKLQLP